MNRKAAFEAAGTACAKAQGQVSRRHIQRAEGVAGTGVCLEPRGAGRKTPFVPRRGAGTLSQEP